MIHYSAPILKSDTFSWYVNEGIDSTAFRQGRILLADAMKADLGRLTPAEERTMNNFEKWVNELKHGNALSQGCFAYVNLNTGCSLVFVAWHGYEEYGITYLQDEL